MPERKKLGRPVLSNEEKILLTLLDHSKPDPSIHASFEITQKGLSKATGIRVNHIPRLTKNLMEYGEIDDYLAYVHGASRKRKAYSLTELGLKRAKEIKRSVLDSKVLLSREEGEEIVSLGKIAKESSQNILDLVELIDESGTLEEGLVKKSGGETVRFMKDAPGTEDFQGRHCELEKMEKWLAGNGNLLVITGMKGMGKSYLVSDFVKNAKGYNVLWLKAGGTTSEKLKENVMDYLKGFSLDARQDMPEKISKQVILSSEGGELILVFDDVYNPGGKVLALVNVLLKDAVESEGVKCIITTRHEELSSIIGDYGVLKRTEYMDLKSVDNETARKMLPEGVDLDDDSLHVLMDMTNGNPMALSLLYRPEIERYMENTDALTKHEILIMRCLKAMDMVLTT